MLEYLPNPLIIPVGIVIGMLIAAPVGPVNVLCVQRAIERGFWGGLAAGIGSVLGDGLIALCAGLGVGAISGAVKNNRAIIQVVGGLALMAFGLRLYFANPILKMASDAEADGASLQDFIWDIPQTFFLTITNPGAVLGLFAIFGGVSTFVEVGSNIDVLLMVAAIMGGSLMWWISLSNFISRHRHRMDARHLQLVNRVAGILLAGFGALLLAEVIWKAGRF
jgi:threonine/homoserine/homoserine lactone efflux protein